MRRVWPFWKREQFAVSPPATNIGRGLTDGNNTSMPTMHIAALTFMVYSLEPSNP